MRRLGDVWATITAFDNLRAAALRAACGKRRVKGIARFLLDLEPEILRLQRDLLDGSYRPGTPVTFVVHDPKVRTITAAPFRDRVVHHALIDPLEPFFDRRLIAASFACRRGKGQHAALRHARRLLRRHGWFLKLDVQRFFPSLRHDVVLDTLARLLKDRRTLALCATIVRAGGSDGCGLPIGHLTSQWFANLVLGRLDRAVTEGLRAPGYVRYLDDFVLFADDKAALRAAHTTIAEHLAALGLVLKARATLLAPVTQGLPFLGFRLYRGTARLRPENLRRTRARLRRRQGQFRRGQLDEAALADSHRSVIAHMRHGATHALRRAWFAEQRSAADRRRLEPRQPRRQLQQPGRQRALEQPQQQRTCVPQQQRWPSCRQDVAPPDPGDRSRASPGCAP